MEKSQQRTVVITGCDIPKSYGYELALCLDKHGYSVFAGCTDCNSFGARSLASRGSTNLAIMQIDVTKQEDIIDATEMIQDTVGEEGVWAVVNCAESYIIAEVDWCSCEDFSNTLDVNFMGTVRVTKSLLHLVRKARGRVVNLSSMSGCVARAGQSAFCASKFAIEAFSDSLRQEMIKWGVFVSIVQPAFFPEMRDVLSDEDTTNLIKHVPSDAKQVYGDDYFVSYIRSVTTSTSTRNNADVTSSPASDSGYNTLKDDAKRKRGMSSYEEATASLKIPPSLGNTNRVLHALVDAVTSSSPRVRYFVGSFHDRVLRACNEVLPSVLLDTYMTSGELAKLVPKQIKEKLD